MKVLSTRASQAGAEIAGRIDHLRPGATRAPECLSRDAG